MGVYSAGDCLAVVVIVVVVSAISTPKYILTPVQSGPDIGAYSARCMGNSSASQPSIRICRERQIQNLLLGMLMGEHYNKNSSEDEIVNVNLYAVRPEGTRIR